LKPENMFYKDGRVILIDFGSSDDLTRPELRQTKIDDDPRRRRHVNFVGTS
jgi:serine/threonine protein kinase